MISLITKDLKQKSKLKPAGNFNKGLYFPLVFYLSFISDYLEFYLHSI